jgi:ABC-type branched-subunit amino acid transport system ATPase component
MIGDPAALLMLDGVSRAFGGVRAVDHAGLSVAAGEVHGLIGPNGAGKTTLLNLISGLQRPEAGVIRLAGRRIDGLPAYRIAELGIRRTYQNIRLFAGMSTSDNVLVGLHSRRRDRFWQRLLFAPAGRAAERWARERAEQALLRVGVTAQAHDRAGALSYGDQRRLEIARALASQPLLLLLDEPTAGMTPVEAGQIGDLILSVASEGTAVLLVEHNVELVMRVSSRLTVLDFGEVIAEGPPDAVRRDPAVISAYLGTEV